MLMFKSITRINDISLWLVSTNQPVKFLEQIIFENHKGVHI
jgi:hypothetical protein